MEDRELGRLEEKVNNLPTHEQVGNVRSELLTAVNEGMARLERMLDKHEVKTKECVDDTVTKTVDAAFSLQWAKLETAIATAIAQKVPDQPKRDWMPYYALGVVAIIAGFEKVLPYLRMLFGA